MEQEKLIHVAYAEDHNIMRKAIIGLLESTGDIVVDIEAEDGRELLDKLERAAVLPQICILDLNMEGLNGYDTLVEIRKRWPDMRSLILTAYADEMHVIRMMQAGANGYLIKKCCEDDLHAALRSIHTDGYYYSEWANNTLFHLVRTNAIKLPELSEIELKVMKLCCTEMTYDQIAEKLNLSFRQVDGHRDRLFQKLDIKTRVQLAMYAIRTGFINPEIDRPGKI